MHQKKVLADDWNKGENIEYNGMSGYVNFICHEYITMCVREYEKPEELARNAKSKMHQVCLLVYNKYWDKVIRKDNV